MARTALYRHFDAEGRLLYVGISCLPLARMAQHEASAWCDQIASITLEWHESRAAALRAETSAIHSERPLHNRTKRAVAAASVQEFHTDLLTRISGFCASKGMDVCTFGRMAVNDNSLVQDLASGRELRSKTVARIEAFMAGVQ